MDVLCTQSPVLTSASDILRSGSKRSPGTTLSHDLAAWGCALQSVEICGHLGALALE